MVLQERQIDLTTLAGFTTMVAKKGLEKAEPLEPGPPALHPLQRMRHELFQVKCLQEHTYSFFVSAPKCRDTVLDA